MTLEMIQTAITTVAEEVVKASMKGSLAAAMMGHAAAIGGLAAGLPTADATEAIGQVIGMIARVAIAVNRPGRLPTGAIPFGPGHAIMRLPDHPREEGPLLVLRA